MNLINANLQKIIELCKKYRVKTLSVFGSILTDSFNEDSDVDFSVTFHSEPDPFVSGANFSNLYIALQELFDRKIDLVEESIIRNKYFKDELDETKQVIYGSKTAEIYR